MDDSVDFRAASLCCSLPGATQSFLPDSLLNAMSHVRKRDGVPLVLNLGAFAREAHGCRAWAVGREGVQA